MDAKGRDQFPYAPMQSALKEKNSRNGLLMTFSKITMNKFVNMAARGVMLKLIIESLQATKTTCMTDLYCKV